ncbi:MAG TPA: cation:proton antiporter [archaeon]|nr:cation:proton antiporter [archaeon]
MAVEGFTLLFDLGLILLFATLLNFIARILNQPPLLAYIAAGIIIGPFALGSLGINFFGISFGVSTTEEILLLSELGVAFLLFSVGVETDLRKMLEFGKIAILGSIMQVAMTVATVFAFNYLWNFLSFEQALYLGIIVAFSSTTIVVKLLSDFREINTLHGRLMIGFLLVQDILVILALPLLENVSNLFSVSLILPLILKVLAILLLAYAMSRYIYPKIFAFAVQSEELLFLSAMSSVFFFIFISSILGFSIAVGAFIAGVALSTLPYNLEVLHKIRGVRDFLATIFFVTLGIQIAPSFVSFPLGLALIIILLVFFFKPLIYYAITSLSGYGGRVSLLVALSLAQVSEFSFVIASQGRQILEQTPGLYPFIILIISLSMALTPYFMGTSAPIYSFVNKKFLPLIRPLKESKLLHRRLSELEHLGQNISGHVVIIGAGTVGSSIAASIKEDYPVVVVDSDSEVVKYNIEHEIDAIYGSVDNPEVWMKVGIEKARILVLAIPYAKPSIALIKYAKSINPKIVVFARAHHFKDTLSLYENGVDYVVMPQVVGSNLFIKKVAEFLQRGNIEEISNYRREFIDYLREKVVEEERLRKM